MKLIMIKSTVKEWQFIKEIIIYKFVFAVVLLRFVFLTCYTKSGLAIFTFHCFLQDRHLFPRIIFLFQYCTFSNFILHTF